MWLWSLQLSEADTTVIPIYGLDNWRRTLSTSGYPSVLCSNMVGTLGNNCDPPPPPICLHVILAAINTRLKESYTQMSVVVLQVGFPAAVTVSKNSLTYRIVSLQWRKTVTTMLPVCLTFLQLELRGGDVYAPRQWQWATAPSQLCQRREKELVCDSMRCCMVLR